MQFLSIIKSVKLKSKLRIILNSNGAMFGLDARIALAIFAGLSIIVGTSLISLSGKIYGSSLSDELSNFGVAIESIHQDIRVDLHGALTVSNDANAFQALYDSSVLKAAPKIKWNGPYIDFRSNTHPRYGAMTIVKKQNDHTTACSAIAECTLWLVINDVDVKVATYANENSDGVGEASPESNGRIQWAVSGSKYNVWYRVSKALKYN